MHQFRTAQGLIAGLCMISCLGGCGVSRGPQLVPVTGTVTLDGKPLAGATVVFHPELPPAASGKTQVIESQGITGNDGVFHLMNIHDGEKGAQPGLHKVTVTKLVMYDGSDVPPNTDLAILGPNGKELVPSLYTNVTQTTLGANIPPAGGNVNLELKSVP